MAKLPGKFGRFRSSSQNVVGPFRWGASFRRERIDTTNFESVLSATGKNLHTEGETGPLDSMFTVEGHLDTTVINLFFPDAAITCDLLYRKDVALGYKNVSADVLDFAPGIAVREAARFTAQLQSNGLIPMAA